MVVMLRKALLITISTLAVLLVGFGGMSLLMSRRTLPQPQVQEKPGKLVRVMTVQLQEVPLTVQGYGTVRPKTEWSVISEVSGPLAQLSPNLRAGLYVARGELLFEVDPRPYRLVVQQIRAQIEQHQKQIDVLRQQRRNYEDTLRFALRNLKIADEEFRRDKALVGKGMISARERDQRQQSHNEVEQVVQTARNDLALIGPRIQEIQAAIAAAQAQLADAELKLDKTRLLAPFNGQVINSNLEVGEFVQAGNEVATLYDTAAVEIPIALSPD
jgi:multidrug resistance efflux pump